MEHPHRGSVGSSLRTVVGCIGLLAVLGACSAPTEPPPLDDVQSLGAIEPSPQDTSVATANPPTDEPATAMPTPVTPPTGVPSELPIDPTQAPPTLQPIEPPTAPPAVPTEPPAPRPEFSDPAADRNCSDFTDGWEAQAWWDYWRARGSNNPGGLDGDGDGDVCESKK